MEEAKIKKAELIFIPSPGIGHLVSAVEMAKLLINRDQRLSITLLIMKLPFETKTGNSYTQSLSTDATARIRFLDLPQNEADLQINSRGTFLFDFIENQKALVRDAVTEITRSGETKLVGFVVDMFCTTMIDLANEFGVPTHVFFTSNAAVLGLMFHHQYLRDYHNQDITEYNDSDADLLVPSYINPVPAKLLPSILQDKDGGYQFLNFARRYRETKGIIINSFLELESHAIKSLSDPRIPPVYPVGPILNISNDNKDHKHESDTIMKWLDDQPVTSVIFLCFGSMGSFDDDQVKEIAHALEHSGHRFLWSLRQPPAKEKIELPSEYNNFDEVLPEGFLERTVGLGKVIGWAPQVAVLSHPAVGGFVTHCGWNSTLESVYFGVPTASWPLYAEQQMNAFLMVKELEMAVEIKMDYKKDLFYDNSKTIVSAEEIENGLKQLMDCGSGVNQKVKEMKEKSRMAMEEGGSSYTYIGSLIEDFMDTVG